VTIYVAQGADGGSATPDLTLNEPQPSGAAYTLVFIASKDTSGPFTNSSSGWTLLGHAENTYDGECYGVFTRNATGAGNAQTISYPGTSSSFRWGFLIALPGTGRTVTLSSAVMAAGIVDTPTGSPAALNAASVTTAGANADLIWVAGEDRDSNFDPAAFTVPSGYTQLGTTQYNGRNSSGAIATKNQAVAGASGAANGSSTFSSGLTATDTFLIVVEAAGGGGGPVALAARKSLLGVGI
jgi:hypothetical protein